MKFGNSTPHDDVLPRLEHDLQLAQYKQFKKQGEVRRVRANAGNSLRS